MEAIKSMVSLEKYGIKDVVDTIYNPSYDLLYNEEINTNLKGFEKGQISDPRNQIPGLLHC